MDFLTPVLGTLTGIEAAHWKDILIFTAKVILFCVPFVAVGFLLERDMIRLPAVSKILKIGILTTFAAPVFLYGLLNLMAPGLPDSFWESYPLLESMWIMEGRWPPIILMGIVVLFVVLYCVEIVEGDLTK
ncbi:MAG: hypothetical protein JSV26_07390 [bacterium]|nr:MAG: hypothetical protein JSV26_07390 [bacterium]